MPETLPIYEDALGRQCRNPWVEIVFFQGHQYDDPHLTRLLEADWPDAHTIAEYLANWDYGNETDGAHTTDEDPFTADPYATAVELELAVGHDYVLTMNRQLGLVGLYRRPLDWEEGAFAS